MIEAIFARVHPRRSVLYVPASNSRAIDKARVLACDSVILDLEDAVAPEAKAQARQAAVAAVETGGFGAREVIVRVNALSTEWGRADLEAIGRTQITAVLVPKIDNAADIMTYQQLLHAAPAPMQLWSMIETPLAILHIAQIAASSQHSRLRCLVMGTNDLATQLGMRLTPERGPLAGILALMVAAARAYSLTALDGVYNAYQDAIGFERQCQQGADYGFDGKTLIHPKQIDRCNACFGPSSESIAWATKVKAAFDEPENAKMGALTVDGSMVERLHLRLALNILALDVAIRGKQA